MWDWDEESGENGNVKDINASSLGDFDKARGLAAAGVLLARQRGKEVGNERNGCFLDFGEDPVDSGDADTAIPVMPRIVSLNFVRDFI